MSKEESDTCDQVEETQIATQAGETEFVEPPITQHELLLKVPLYEEVDLRELAEEDYEKYVGELELPQKGIDFHCNECGRERLFLYSNKAIVQDAVSNIRRKIENIELQIRNPPAQVGGAPQQRHAHQSNIQQQERNKRLTEEQLKSALSEDRYFYIIYECQSNRTHTAFFAFFLRDKIIRKVGQAPTFADIEISRAKKYRKVLKSEKIKELNRGIGLASHGVGIGSYVYLRRVFEDVIEDAHQLAITNPDWDEKTYTDARMHEKISLLADQLPAFLVENASLYSMLSDGVHNLTEDQCLAYFDPIYAAIKLILDEKIAEVEKERATEEARKALAKARSELAAR